MADIEFGNFAYACDGADVSCRQSMTSGDVQAVLSSECRAFTQTPQFVICTRGSFAMNSHCAESRFRVGGRA